jgi:hypothetical protein
MYRGHGVGYRIMAAVVLIAGAAMIVDAYVLGVLHIFGVL